MSPATLGGLLAAAATGLVLLALGARVDGRVDGARALVSAGGRVARPPRRSGAAVRALERIGRTRVLGFAVDRPRIDRRLGQAGLALSGEAVVGAKVAMAAGATAVALVGPGSLRLLLIPALAAGGFLLPEVLLVRAARRRLRRIDRSLPELLDLLAAASAAGLAAPLALRRAARSLRGPLAEELGSLLVAVDHGARWREEMASLAARLELSDLRRTAAAVGRTERLGTPLAESLRELAADVREDRRTAAAERARKAPVKMLFPLVLLVLPAFLLLAVVPVLLVTLRSIR
ncbi:MAG: type II secretion system F family protein [Actinobacteria bacterium]|nr:type II secretion system F family protein [Actinomycetota bacterium]